METIIKVSPSELNAGLLSKIRKIIGKKDNIDVTISLKEYDAAYAEALERSIDEAESGQNLISFTSKDFMAYTPSKKGL